MHLDFSLLSKLKFVAKFIKCLTKTRRYISTTEPANIFFHRNKTLLTSVEINASGLSYLAS